MTVSELQEKLSLTALSLPHGEKEVTGGYAGDLLSWVMANAQSGDAWITIMSNLNVPAVAMLTDVSCVILAENVQLSTEDLHVAKEKEINLLSSNQSVFALCASLSSLLK